ncbi:Crp/Fnr family transcriptional regulator [Halarcobacter mediterraneus]|uniref:Crp/Fnr family transcriptional regulator n=1 Tax=Halarcobacter mediterraneus TaxID=2023153 RepID=A0A4Q1AWJ5_9BACT|nr:Crp/Fnr family transcriptional regulator [Halarcobacter mediterraneus]RXK13198.1 Crp/Fnr family transcriptional regulator [Halarcobacter mediterraneus]
MKKKLSEIYLFKNLSDEVLEQMEDFTSILKLSKNNILFYEGDESKYLYLLTDGIIKLYKTSSNDKEIILKYFHKNELIAEVANFEQIPYPATAQSFTDTELLKIDFEKLKELIFLNPQLSYLIQKSLIQKVRNLENLISLHLVLDSKKRVAKYIYDNADDFFNTKNLKIAEILNISPETFSRVLSSLKKEKVVDTKNKMINKEALKEIYT